MQKLGGRDVNKGEQFTQDSRDLFNKMSSLDKFLMKDKLKGYKPSEVHCIEFIENIVDPNVTKLAESFYMTRGAISKLTKKLIAKGLVESYQRSDNQKEIYFKLTKQGKAIYNIHEQLHRDFQKRDKAVFEHLSEKELDIMLDFIERYRRHIDFEIQKLGVIITSGTDFE